MTTDLKSWIVLQMYKNIFNCIKQPKLLGIVSKLVCEIVTHRSPFYIVKIDLPNRTGSPLKCRTLVDRRAEIMDCRLLQVGKIIPFGHS